MLLVLHLQLAGSPQPRPGELIAPFRRDHGFVHQVFQLAALALDLLPKAVADVRVEEAHLFPQGNAAVFEQLLSVLL